MSDLTEADITRLGQLARLQLSAEQTAQACTHINAFFHIVEKMSAVDTKGIAPLFHPLSMIQEVSLRLCDDVAAEPNQREANQRSAPAVEDGLFLVPRVVE